MSAADRTAGDSQKPVPPRLEYERELLFGEPIATVAALLESQGITQRELAERLGRSEARISRVLGGGENTTLKTVADLGHALGIRFALVPVPYESRDGTPAAEDPDPPEWLDRQRRRLASEDRAAAPGDLD